MSHYDLEDVPTQDGIIDMAIQSAQTASQLVELTPQHLAAAHEKLAAIYEAAPPESQALVEQTWHTVQHLGDTVTKLDAGMRSALAAVESIKQQRDAKAAELNSLVEAIECVDEDHPLLEEYAIYIRETESEDSFASGLDWASNQQLEEVVQNLEPLCHELGIEDNISVYIVAGTLIDILQDLEVATSEQIALLSQLIRTTKPFTAKQP